MGVFFGVWCGGGEVEMVGLWIECYGVCVFLCGNGGGDGVVVGVIFVYSGDCVVVVVGVVDCVGGWVEGCCVGVVVDCYCGDLFVGVGIGYCYEVVVID